MGMTIRKVINFNKLDKDTRALMMSGVVTKRGNLSKLGRRILCDILFEDKSNRKKVLEAVRSASNL